MKSAFFILSCIIILASFNDGHSQLQPSNVLDTKKLRRGAENINLDLIELRHIGKLYVAPTGKQFIKTSLGNKYLDCFQRDMGTPTELQIADFNQGMKNQIWEIKPSPEAGYYYIKSEQWGYLDVQWGNSSPGTPVHIWEFNGGDAQKWKFVSDDGKNFALQSKLRTFLEVKGGSAANYAEVWMASANAGPAQQWQFETAFTVGKQYISTALSNRYLDVAGMKLDAGTSVQIWDNNGGGWNQIWEVIQSSEPGYYYIKSEGGRYLDVQWGNNAAGTTVHIWDFNGGDAQKWKITSVGDGYFTIQSKLGTFLDVKGAQKGNGTQVWTWSGYDTPPAAQKWRFSSAGAGNVLRGFADMHTHPMSHLGFGGKLIHGAPDIGVLVPAIPSGSGCRHYQPAANAMEAIGSCRATHEGWGLFDNTCGDTIRNAILKGTEGKRNALIFHDGQGAKGFGSFAGWPAWNDITHQKMWIDWVKRTYENGLRVMVALTVNNATLAAAVSGTGDRNPDDVSSSNVQLDELKRMVARHNGSAGSVDNWMEIAYSASDLKRIVNSNRLAVVIGVEIDNIGNFHQDNSIHPNRLTESTKRIITDELDRLYHQGVRYVFPIHLIDNKFGGTAIDEDMFNLSNYHQIKKHWDIECAGPFDGITKKFVIDGFNAELAAAKTKIGVDIFRYPPTPPNCNTGHVNRLGLTVLGEFALKEMMKRGMMIDVDHMSKKSMDKTLSIAARVPNGGYPVNAGHNGIRGDSGSERSLSRSQAWSIKNLGGVIGVGMEKTPANIFVQNFNWMLGQLGADAPFAIGTDINGFVQMPPPRPGSSVAYNADFPMSRTGSKSWDYNQAGVAHYGLLPDFFKDVDAIDPSRRIFSNHLMKSAEYFAQMWEKCDRQKVEVR